MRRATFICVVSLALAACADQRLMGLAQGPAAIGSLIPVRVVSRCALDHGPALTYRPFYVIDGRVHLPGDTAAVNALNPDLIAEIHILKGEAASARYGPVAAMSGVVLITTRPASGGRPRPAT